MRQRSLHKNLDVSVFAQPLTPEAIYWIGFLLADGSICPPSHCQAQVTLGLSQIDGDHVKKFAAFIGANLSGVKFRDLKNNAWSNIGVARFSIACTELYDLLYSYGLRPNKSGKEQVDPRFSLNPDFWRGYIDGDGSITFIKQRYPVVQVGGSKEVCDAFCKLCLAITGFSPTIQPCRSIFHSAIGCEHAAKLLNFLYYPGCVGLARKIKLAEFGKRYKSTIKLKPSTVARRLSIVRKP